VWTSRQTADGAAACYRPGVRALATYLAVQQHLPVERATQVLGDGLGAGVSAGTLAGLVAEGAAGLGGFVDRAARRRPATLRGGRDRTRTCDLVVVRELRPLQPPWPACKTTAHLRIDGPQLSEVDRRLPTVRGPSAAP
jgi:hypothetical protein